MCDAVFRHVACSGMGQSACVLTKGSAGRPGSRSTHNERLMEYRRRLYCRSTKKRRWPVPPRHRGPPPPAHTHHPVCAQAYWPFHRSECKRNEFADLVEEHEPRFAKWMRGHGKLAVLKDDEVDRLERASMATTGQSREEVMESMYGRLDPKPRCE